MSDIPIGSVIQDDATINRLRLLLFVCILKEHVVPAETISKRIDTLCSSHNNATSECSSLKLYVEIIDNKIEGKARYEC